MKRSRKNESNQELKKCFLKNVSKKLNKTQQIAGNAKCNKNIEKERR